MCFEEQRPDLSCEPPQKSLLVPLLLRCWAVRQLIQHVRPLSKLKEEILEDRQRFREGRELASASEKRVHRIRQARERADDGALGLAQSSGRKPLELRLLEPAVAQWHNQRVET